MYSGSGRGNIPNPVFRKSKLQAIQALLHQHPRHNHEKETRNSLSVIALMGTTICPVEGEWSMAYELRHTQYKCAYPNPPCVIRTCLVNTSALAGVRWPQGRGLFLRPIGERGQRGLLAVAFGQCRGESAICRN